MAAHALIDLNKASWESYMASGGRQSPGKAAMVMAMAKLVVAVQGRGNSGARQFRGAAIQGRGVIF